MFKHLFSVLIIIILSPSFAAANEYNVYSEFLQLLDFESSVPIYTDEETNHLTELVEKLLTEKTECSLGDLEYSHRQPEFEDVEMYYSGFLPKLGFSLYGDVWQYEILEANVICGDNIKDFQMTHFIEDGVRLKASQGLFKTEDHWMEVRVSYYNGNTNETDVYAIYSSESNYKAGVGSVFVDRDSVVFDKEVIKP